MHRRFGFPVLALLLMSASASADDPAPASTPAASASAAPVSPTAARDRFVGNFNYAGGDKEKKGIDVAIDKALEGLFFVEKPFAISALHDKTAVKNAVGFHFANGKVTSTASDAPPATSPDDGTYAPYKVDGETLRISQSVNQAGHLIQIFASNQGSRTNDYTLLADGKTLIMTVTITSGRLPRAVHYALTYKRNE